MIPKLRFDIEHTKTFEELVPGYKKVDFVTPDIALDFPRWYSSGMVRGNKSSGKI